MAVKKHTIPLRESGQFSSIFLDYLENKETLRPFYSYRPEPASFKKAIDDIRSYSFDRALLSETILKQYNLAGIDLSDAPGVAQGISSLAKEGVYTVCTGHQPVLFGGPLYFIYKIISTIRLAEELNKANLSAVFVPVYWIGSEDHDLEEIGTVNVFGKKLKWDTDQKGAVGRMNTGSLKPMIDEVRKILGESENAREIIKVFEDAYTKHKSVKDGIRYIVHVLFGAHKLVIIDGDDPKLKERFLPLIKDDITNKTNFRLVNDSIGKLKSAGYEAQVNPREINVFQLTSNDRVRIETASEAMLKLKPEEYSTNVVLRPLYQQMILPNIAYVGGPGEIAYWLEYKAMFDHHRIFFPVLMPRNFSLLTDEKVTQQMLKLGLDVKTIFRDTEAVIKEYVAKNTEKDISLKEQEESVKKMYAQLADKAAAVDPTLKASVESELQKALSAIKNIESKMMRSEKQKQETNTNQIRKIREKFLPEGELQERHDNFSPFYLKAGKALIPSLMDAFDPFEFKLLIIEL